MKTTIKLLKSLFQKRKYTLGKEVFQSQTWLEKQVAEKMWQKAFKLD